MVALMKTLGIDRLSVEERLNLVHEIWDSIAAESDSSLTQEQQAELARRSAEHQASPDDVVAWDHIKTEALNRFTQ